MILDILENRHIIKAVKYSYDNLNLRKDEVIMEEKVIDKLRRGQKVLCSVCKKSFYDVNIKNVFSSNYFHCSDPLCKGYVHEQKRIDIE